MMKMWSFFLIVFGSTVSLGSSFVVSEIYSNSVGKGADKNKEWIEIANLSHSEIIIRSLELKIYRGKNRQLIFEKNISLLNEPVVFLDFLLIAQAKNLGLNLCLKREIPILIMPDFSLDNDQEHHLCITINDKEQSCLTTLKNNNADGLALFCDFFATTKIAWLHEPCHLVDGIFATPGRPARACLNNENFRDEIFDDCQTPIDNACYSFEEGHSPKISSSDISFDNHTAKVKLNFSDEDQDDLWWIFPCISPKNSKKICHKTEAKRILPGVETTFLLHPFNEAKDKLYFLLNDLYGSTVLVPTYNAFAKADFFSLSRPLVGEYRYNAEHVHLTLFVDESPLNISLLAADGRVLDQRSFIERGEKNIVMTHDQARYLNFSSPTGNSVIDLESYATIPIRFSG